MEISRSEKIEAVYMSFASGRGETGSFGRIIAKDGFFTVTLTDGTMANIQRLEDHWAVYTAGGYGKGDYLIDAIEDSFKIA